MARGSEPWCITTQKSSGGNRSGYKNSQDSQLFEEILSKLALTLDKSSIPYMIIGGQAVLLYGEPRLTRDIR